MFNDLFEFESIEGGLFIAIVFFILIILLIALVSNILVIVAKWKLLKMSGKEGWEAIIPVYNKVVFCQISGLNPWWILVTMISPLLCSIPVLGTILSQVIIIYFSIIFNISIAKSYGKEEIFGIGLWLLPPVFWLILAFGNTKYIGKNGIDPVMNYINKNTSDSSNDTIVYCSHCGYKNVKDANFCKNCGSKINK